MRKVTTYKLVYSQNRTPEVVEDGRGFFHQWGFQYEEFESGPGNYTVAVVEMLDGHVKTVPADLIRFDTDENGKRHES